jgi:predicted transposase YdaD
MSQPADIGGKRLLSLSPENWIQWVTQLPQVKIEEFMSSDFQWVSRENDVLLNELQLRYNNHIPRRMRAYAALAEERYRWLVYPVDEELYHFLNNMQ